MASYTKNTGHSFAHGWNQVPKSSLGGFTLPPIATLIGTLLKLQYPPDTMIQLNKPLDATTNMFLLPIVSKDIAFPKKPERRMFSVADDNLHDTSIQSDDEHAPWDGSDLVPKDYWDQVEEILPVDIPPTPPVAVAYQNDSQYMIKVGDTMKFKVDGIRSAALCSTVELGK